MDREGLAEQALQQKFRITRFKAGYDLNQVDQLLDEAVLALRDGAEPGQIVQLLMTARLTQTRWRDGYRIDDVDDFLDSLVRSLSQG